LSWYHPRDGRPWAGESRQKFLVDEGGETVNPVWLCVRSRLRQDWRSLVVLTLITALMGSVALAGLAGARRTDTAVGRFLQYAGPMLGQVSADPATMDKIAALPDVAYSEIGALMLVTPVTVDGRPSARRPLAT
jgi:hypothetical protein